MYNPSAFRETRSEVIEAAIAAHRLAALITIGTAGLDASHIPLLYSPAEGGLGVLRGHIAKANSQWKEHLPGTEALAIFSGPQHYISPVWYPAKREHGKVVPTWNYITVHAHGSIEFKHEPEWLLKNVHALTDAQEASMEAPWSVEDAPADYIQSQLNAIVGVELTVTKLEGKWKLGQNRSAADLEGVVAGLQELDLADACEMAKAVKAALTK